MRKLIEAPDTALFMVDLDELPGVKDGLRDKGLAFRILERRARTATLEVVGLKASRAIKTLSKTARREDRAA